MDLHNPSTRSKVPVKYSPNASVLFFKINISFDSLCMIIGCLNDKMN